MSLLTPAARLHGQHSFVGLIKILRVFLNHLIHQFFSGFHHFLPPCIVIIRRVVVLNKLPIIHEYLPFFRTFFDFCTCHIAPLKRTIAIVWLESVPTFFLLDFRNNIIKWFVDFNKLHVISTADELINYRRILTSEGYATCTSETCDGSGTHILKIYEPA